VVTELKELVQMDLEPDSKRMFVKVQQMPNGRTRTFYIFIGAGELAILLEIVGDEEHQTTRRRWHDRIKYFVGYVIQNLWLLMLVWDIFFGR